MIQILSKGSDFMQVFRRIVMKLIRLINDSTCVLEVLVALGFIVWLFLLNLEKRRVRSLVFVIALDRMFLSRIK